MREIRLDNCGLLRFKLDGASSGFRLKQAWCFLLFNVRVLCITSCLASYVVLGYSFGMGQIFSRFGYWGGLGYVSWFSWLWPNPPHCYTWYIHIYHTYIHTLNSMPVPKRMARTLVFNFVFECCLQGLCTVHKMKWRFMLGTKFCTNREYVKRLQIRKIQKKVSIFQLTIWRKSIACYPREKMAYLWFILLYSFHAFDLYSNIQNVC